MALAGIAGCNAPAQQHEQSARRMLYVVPEALPEPYGWQIHGELVSDIVWVGLRLNRKGGLTGAGTVLAVMLRHSSATMDKQISSESGPLALKIHSKETKAPSPAMEIHSRAPSHYLLIGLADTQAGKRILTDTKTRAHSRSALLNLVKEYTLVKGLQLDFEYLPSEYASAFVAYVHELRAALPKDKSLHIAVFPPVGMPEAWRGFHNLPELALAGDGIVVMQYDYHRPGTAPGCVSGISWLNDNARTLVELPREKIWLGAPLYGYHFKGKTAQVTGKSQFERRRGSRSEADGCYRIQSAAGETYYPSQALYAAYDRLVRENHFAGVAWWRAGFER